MSLTGPRTYAGYEQADVASLEADGVFYRCYVYLSRATWAVEAVCTKVEADGTQVQVFRNVVASVTQDALDNGVSIPLDSPKIIARGTVFIVHWLQCDELVPIGEIEIANWQLYRATMEMTAFDATAWDPGGAVALLQTSLLYDVCPVLEHDDDFIVARHTAENEVRVVRYNGVSWIDTEWSTDLAVTIVESRVLGVYAHDTDNDVVISYQSDDTWAGQLWSTRISASAGTGDLSVHTFPDFVDVDTGEGTNPSDWVQIGHCRVGDNRVAVVAETRSGAVHEFAELFESIDWVHHLVYREINSDTCARVGNEHWTAHLHMMSRPWAYAGGSSTFDGTPNVYVVAGYRSIVDPDEWQQSYAYALNLDYAMWNVVDSGAGLRARPISTYWTRGIPDTRASGWTPTSIEGFESDVHSLGPTKRQNQISHASGAPPFGPDIKTRTIALITFGTIGTQSDYAVSTDSQVQVRGPERALLGAFKVFMEDPWLRYRDDSDPEQPTENFHGAYPRAMHQSVPCGLGMFVGGGTPQLYDGAQMVECGFPWKPEIVDYFENGTGGTITQSATYSYYALFSWTDNKGQIHRSGPSNTITFTTASDTASVSLVIRNLTTSLKDASAYYPLSSPISIEVYRTEANATVFYRVFGSVDSATYAPVNTPVNNPEFISGFALVVDGVGDAALILQGEGPYGYVASSTTLAEPLPITIPAMSVVTAHANRIFGASSIDPAVIYYSDEILPFGNDFYAAPVFATGQVFRIGEIGEITAMQGMNNALIVFSASKIYSLTMQDAGSGLLSIQAELLHEATGCIEPRSVVLTSLGILFQSTRGYFLLSRSRETGYYTLARSRDDAPALGGAAIEDDIAEGGNIRSATLLEDRRQVRVVTNGRPVTTQTWTFTITTNGTTAGVWGIFGLSQPVEVTLGDAVVANTIADTIAARVQELIDAAAPDTLRFEVASVTSPTNTVVLELVGDVDLTLVGMDPPLGLGTNVASVTEAIETQPRVLLCDEISQRWSRGELPQTNADTRQAELVDGCSWKGDGESLHVALAQGAILIERRSNSGALEYADQTAGGNLSVPLDVTTSWIHLAGIAGYQRTRSIGVQTERFNDGAIHVDIEYDRDGSYSGQAIEPSTYDWNNPAPAYLRIRPREQKVTGMRLRIYETSGVASTENVAIIALVFDVGLKPGLRRVADGQIGSA